LEIRIRDYWTNKSGDHLVEISDFYKGNVTFRSGITYDHLSEKLFRDSFRHVDAPNIRHFHITYKTDTGTSTFTLTSEGMFNLKNLCLDIEISMGVTNPNILSWVELSQDDYDAFNA
jgi:hypothetical protein